MGGGLKTTSLYCNIKDKNMGNEFNLKYSILSILFCSFIISGCYSFREVSKEDYLKNEKHPKTKVILNNKEELIIDENENNKVTADNEKIIIVNDTSTINVSFSDIDKIMQERFDIIKTFFGTFWLSLATFVVLGLIFIAGGFLGPFG